MVNKSYTYRCPMHCPINKHCFIIKLEEPLTQSLKVLKKCIAKKADIKIIFEVGQPP